MSNCNPFKVSLKSLYSYNELMDLPRINGVEIRGDLSFKDIGLDDWFNGASFPFIRNSSDGAVNANGFVIQEVDETETRIANVTSDRISISKLVKDRDLYSSFVYSDMISLYDDLYGFYTEIFPGSITISTDSSSVTLDVETVEALISLL